MTTESLAAAIYQAHPAMRRLTQKQQRADLLALSTLVGSVGEAKVRAAIGILKSGVFTGYAVRLASCFSKMLDHWSDIEAAVWPQKKCFRPYTPRAAAGEENGELCAEELKALAAANAWRRSADL